MLDFLLKEIVKEALKELYGIELQIAEILLQRTRKDVEGDFTINVFPYLKQSKKSPEATATEIGSYILNNVSFINKFDVIKGFLNIVISDDYWIRFVGEEYSNPNFGIKKPDSTSNPILIEYSSPNTNKPLHLGHIRNNLLGFSIAEILKANGNKVVKVNLVNDRGIHICKSMLAWERWGNGETPDSSGLKGDHLVGKYYVLYDKAYKQEIKELVEAGTLEENADEMSELMQDARQMLRDWENNDNYTTKLWLKMNKWVCDGFEETYKNLGIDFDKVYYESDTYLLGKEIVQIGLEKNILYTEENGSVWIDLTDEGLDKKLLLRADGTSVYMTQDLGTAELRVKDFSPEKMLYVVGNEQNYHFDVLKKVLKKLDYNWAEGIVHISYGMVELPHGKMKSREGTVVDADDLIAEMVETAKVTTTELGKVAEFSEEEANKLFHTIGMGALKYYILKVDPKKKMLFNPAESIDFNGNTGPFIQYTYARINSLCKKAHFDLTTDVLTLEMHEKEKELVKRLSSYPDTIELAAETYSPAQIANFAYELAKEYNQFYHECPVLKEENQQKAIFRLQLSVFTANILRSSMKMLGIEVPERM